MNKNIRNFKIIKFLKDTGLKNLEKNIKYKLIFFTGLTIFSYFFIFKNIISIKREKTNLEILEIKKQESFFKKEKLEEKINFFKIEQKKKNSQEQKEESKEFFIYKNSSVFKIDFENRLKKYGFKLVESSRLEKTVISEEILEKNELFYEIKVYYEILGKIKDLKKIIFLSEEEFYRFERENLIINFNEKNESVNLKIKVKYFSYEKNNEDGKNNFSLEKMNKINFSKIRLITLKNKDYCILESENKKKEIIKMVNKNIKLEKILCKEKNDFNIKL